MVDVDLAKDHVAGYYRAHYGRLVDVARNVGLSHQDAEDVVQDVFTALCDRITRNPKSPSVRLIYREVKNYAIRLREKIRQGNGVVSVDGSGWVGGGL